MADSGASQPLLGAEPTHRSAPDDGQHETEHPGHSPPNSGFVQYHRVFREFLCSRGKHYIVMGAVALDVMTLLANIFIQLIACEMHQADEPWVKRLVRCIEDVGLLFSSLFMVELIACLACFGFGYLRSGFHLFDSIVIVLSFIIDVTAHGLAESIGSLVVILRLWRLAKISEEIMLGATERMEMLEQHVYDVEAENKELRLQLGLRAQDGTADAQE